jgi:hypothetical protein
VLRKFTYAFLVLTLAFLALQGNYAVAQTVSGIVVDAKSGSPLPFVNVYYEGKGVGAATDENGNFSVPYRKGWNILTISSVGFKKMEIPISGPIENLKVRLEVNSQTIKGVSIKGKRKKYDRKNNPAVELMRKVIAAKKHSDLRRHDYFSYQKYEKRTFALNEFTEKVFDDEHFKKLPFLKERVETCPETGKLILPISVDETFSKRIFKKDGNIDKTIVEGRNSTGLNEFFNTGDIATTMIEDVFTDVDIYDNNIHVLQSEFVSPLSSSSGISFYRYFIADTLDVDGIRCIEVTFTPNNSQDFGFNGSLYIMADSTYRVHKATLNLPHNNAVNFVSDMYVSQEFETLPTGEQVIVNDNMIVQISVIGSFTKFHIKRDTYYSNYSLEEIPDKEFKFLGKERLLADAMMKDNKYWNSVRPEPLTEKESTMDDFLKKMESTKGFKFVLFVAKAFIENFVETSTDREKPSKVDIGPINTIFSQNFVDGFRLRMSAQTTANLNPHLFAKGYVAYGFKDHKWKGMGELTYSFNKKAYLPREFPVNNLTVTYQYDDASPSDIFMPTDKDNVFTSFRWTKVNHMNYVQKLRVLYEREWENGLRLTAQVKKESNEATAALFYQPLDGTGTPSPDKNLHINKFEMADVMIGLRFQPGATYINTKQRRIATNNDSPIFELNHTIGLKNVLGNDYTYNYTEAKVYKRLYLSSWGKIDTYVKGGIQWNKVPFPLLIMPAANLSYIKERETFSLIDNMEFMNDRFVSIMSGWDMNGKILNRIPLIRKLKWREYIGFNMLWGTLTDKNNPFLAKNAGDSRLFYFPGEFRKDGTFKYQSRVMDKNKPYFEIVAGIHNIFKILHVEYVRRLNYLDNPDIDKWGIRIMLRMTF